MHIIHIDIYLYNDRLQKVENTLINSYADYALIFKSLADETRLKIIEMLSNEELCACKILENFKITQPTLSYHMKILCDSGLVNSRREGAWMRYTINAECLESIKELVSKLSEANNITCNCSEKC